MKPKNQSQENGMKTSKEVEEKGKSGGRRSYKK
jgi:hypothetical protein